MYEGKKVTAIIAAAGSGSRMQSTAAGRVGECGGGCARQSALPKQFWRISGGQTMLEKAIKPFAALSAVDEILVVTGEADIARCRALTQKIAKVRAVLPGGKSRQESVWQAVQLLEDDGYVLVHDAARPYIEEAVITGALVGAAQWGAAVPAVPVKDTIRQEVIAGSGVSETLERSLLYQVQTPQAFRTALLREAYACAMQDGYAGTDDASLVERMGRRVTMTAGSYANLKITTVEDLPKMNMRVGTGFDVHQLTEGRKLILGGVEIPYEKGLLGHSDADVMVHALMDALLGAAALGDIGRHFPDSDPAYAGISSLTLLEKVREKIEAAGYRLVNADVTIIAQRPRLAAYLSAMEENLCRTLAVEIGQINVKATTTEKLGFTGRGEGIASEAACMLEQMI